MKNIVIIFLLITSLSFAQETVIDIDYVVDYAIPNNRNESIDTVSIGFNKSGKYLWTNDEVLTKEFGKSVFLGGANNLNDSDFNIIYDVEANQFIILFSFGKSVIYANLDVETIIPLNKEDGFDDNFNLISELISDQEKLLSQSCSIYELYPESEPEDKLNILVANNLDCKNNVFFSKFVGLMLKMTSSKGEITTELPDGLILKAFDKDGSTLMEAVKIDDNKKTININYSFKITE